MLVKGTQVSEHLQAQWCTTVPHGNENPLFGAKSLPESMLIICQLDAWEQSNETNLKLDLVEDKWTLVQAMAWCRQATSHYLSSQCWPRFMSPYDVTRTQCSSDVTIILIFWPDMVTSSNGNIFRVTGPLCGEFTGNRWIPHTKASDAELWCFLWSAPE